MSQQFQSTTLADDGSVGCSTIHIDGPSSIPKRESNWSIGTIWLSAVHTRRLDRCHAGSISALDQGTEVLFERVAAGTRQLDGLADGDAMPGVPFSL
ncbi:MAG: hypothetical protein K2Y16_10950 [Burkholderiales bacterium]|nr:hypothetical protein [Burkholderiales bacterium]